MEALKQAKIFFYQNQCTITENQCGGVTKNCYTLITSDHWNSVYPWLMYPTLIFLQSVYSTLIWAVVTSHSEIPLKLIILTIPALWPSSSRYSQASSTLLILSLSLLYVRTSVAWSSHRLKYNIQWTSNVRNSLVCKDQVWLTKISLMDSTFIMLHHRALAQI